jgi:ABC-type molybdenum transport system ATPase subunit/photorepair protein PhrA
MNIPTWLQQLLVIVGVIFAGAVAWTTLTEQARNTETIALENRAKIGVISDTLHSMITNQARIEAQLQGEIGRAADYRREVREDLQRILDKLAPDKRSEAR